MVMYCICTKLRMIVSDCPIIMIQTKCVKIDDRTFCVFSLKRLGAFKNPKIKSNS